jgi:hypothetical protein
LINPSGTVVVSPFNMHGWTLYNDQSDAVCTDATVCRFVAGPGTPLAGVWKRRLGDADRHGWQGARSSRTTRARAWLTSPR